MTQDTSRDLAAHLLQTTGYLSSLLCTPACEGGRSIVATAASECLECILAYLGMICRCAEHGEPAITPERTSLRPVLCACMTGQRTRAPAFCIAAVYER